MANTNWRAGLGLKNTDAFSIEQIEVKYFGKPVRKYAAVYPDGKTILLDSVTTILKAGLGVAEQLVDWGCKEVAKDIFAALMPGSHTENGYMDNWRRTKVASEEAKWTFKEMVFEACLHNPGPLRCPDMAEMGLILQRAQTARYRTFEEAGEFGTRVHELIQLWIQQGNFLHTLDGVEYDVDLGNEAPQVQQGFAAFLKFWEREGLEIKFCEQFVADVEFGIGGTADLFVTNKSGDLILLDWKTSKSVYDSHFLQVAAYARIHERMGLGYAVRAYIVHLSKKTGECRIVPVWTNRAEFLQLAQQFMKVVDTARWKKAIYKQLSGGGTHEGDL